MYKVNLYAVFQPNHLPNPQKMFKAMKGGRLICLYGRLWTRMATKTDDLVPPIYSTLILGYGIKKNA